jgi:hypothetical protein
MKAYAQVLQGHDGGTFISHIYPHPTIVKMCGSEPVITVDVRVPVGEEEPTHWAWQDTGSEEFVMIQPSFPAFKVCFPYGYKVEEEAGKGKMVRVVVEVIDAD